MLPTHHPSLGPLPSPIAPHLIIVYHWSLPFLVVIFNVLINQDLKIPLHFNAPIIT
jgi:hypothetical protein